MNHVDILAEIGRLGPWHHDLEIVPGVRTRVAPLSPERTDQRTPTTYRPEDHVREIAGALFPDGFAGRSFLDCACNGGGHSLAAARLGARRCFGFDARAHWVEQANFLKRFAPETEMAFTVAALAELPSLNLPRFDVTLFSGLFYHLPDPVHGLRLAADRTREILILNTAAKYAHGKALQLERESPDEFMSGVDGLAWLPTGPHVLRDILAWCGFPHSRLFFHRPTRMGWSRLELFAARDAAAFAHFDTVATEAQPLRPLTLAQRLAAKMRKRQPVGPNKLVIPADLAAALSTNECRAWVAANCSGPVDGFVADDGQVVISFPSSADARAFRGRWLS
ncbi:MAG TPA: methyltransferase domain-containing protein [Allosphingosinicella sp.]